MKFEKGKSYKTVHMSDDTQEIILSIVRQNEMIIKKLLAPPPMVAKTIDEIAEMYKDKTNDK